MTTIDDVLEGDGSEFVRPVTAKIPRVPRELYEEHERLDALLPTLVSDTIESHPDREPTARRLREIEEEIEASAFEIEFTGIGHRAWVALQAKYPPTSAQLKANRQLEFNPDKFPEAAIAASTELTIDQVIQLTEKRWFNEKCWNELWSACLRVNVVDPAPKSLAASILLRSVESFERHTTTESPAPSSSDE